MTTKCFINVIHLLIYLFFFFLGNWKKKSIQLLFFSLLCLQLRNILHCLLTQSSLCLLLLLIIFFVFLIFPHFCNFFLRKPSTWKHLPGPNGEIPGISLSSFLYYSPLFSKQKECYPILFQPLSSFFLLGPFAEWEEYDNSVNAQLWAGMLRMCFQAFYQSLKNVVGACGGDDVFTETCSKILCAYAYSKRLIYLFTKSLSFFYFF